MIMSINPIDTSNWIPVLGDDNPYFSLAYREVPEGYRFDDLPIPDSELYPMLNANWLRFIAIANSYYRNCEINGETIKDFFDNLNLSLELGKDNIEKILENLNYIVFDKGSVTARIVSESGQSSDTGTRTGNNADNETINLEDKNIELAFNSENADPSTKATKTGTDNINHTINESDSRTGSNSRSMTENITVSRYQGEDGISFFERLINVYPNIPRMFIDMFKDDFVINEVIIW